MRSPALALGFCLLLAGGLCADTYQLADGKHLEGWFVGEAAGTLTILDLKGKKHSFARSELRAVQPGAQADAKQLKKLARARQSFLKSAHRKLDRLLGDYARADVDERQQIAAALTGFDEASRIDPLSEALDERDADTRAFAREQLASIDSQLAIWGLVACSLTSQREAAVMASHQTALASDAEMTRKYYEAVAVNDVKAARRLKAMHFLQDIGSRRSVPALMQVVETAGLEIRAQLARGSMQNSSPTQLGTIGNAASNAIVQLPTISYTGVSTNVNVPVTVLEQLKSSAVGALSSISGQSFGNDVAAWNNWWEDQPEASD